MTRETLVAEHGLRLYIAADGATARLQQRFTTSHGRDVWRDVPKVMGSGGPWVSLAEEDNAPSPKLGASFEIIAQAYASDERASLGIAAAFVAGAEFGAMRAANEFMAASRTPPPTGMAILQDGTLNLAFVANGLRFYADHLEGKPQRGDYFPADLRLAAEMLMADTPPPSTHVVVTDEMVDDWLESACGVGIPFNDATDLPTMLHGLAYVLRQIEATSRYKVHIGQTSPATSALRMALRYFGREALVSALATTEGSTDD